MNNGLKFISSIILAQSAGFLSTPFTINGIDSWYSGLNKPFFNPPNWIFGPVWIVLYTLIGISFYIIWTTDKSSVSTELKNKAYKYFYIQLFLNFLWSVLFFGLNNPLLAFIEIVVLLYFIILTIKSFARISKTASYILYPYLIWVSFASLLNLAILALN